MHLLSARCACALLIQALFFCQVKCMPSVRGMYGETIEIPCDPFIQTENTMMIKWKYQKTDGSPQDLIVKSKDQDPLISVPDALKHRVSMVANSSLLLSGARLTDQGTFTCMVVTTANIFEHQIKLEVLKSPEGLEIFDKAEELEIGKLTKLGVCTAKNANPAAEIMWLKNNQALMDDGKGIFITKDVKVDLGTLLSTTTSTLKYSAQKEDDGAVFTCRAKHIVGEPITSSITLNVTYSPETVELLVTPQDPLVEGDNMTLKCVADGNPAPTSFNFHLKGETIKVENQNAFTITNVTRDASGEYKCSLIDDRGLEASKNVTVNYLDINLSPSGRIEKLAGKALEVTLQIYSSAAHSVSWKKNNRILDNEPKFPKIAYSDSGVYECEVALGPLSRKASFELVVQGAPVISSLSKHSSDDGKYKVLTCEAEGFPKPAVTWNINGTLITESPFSNGKIIQKFAVVPSENLTVQCTVSNKFGSDSKSIDVLPLLKDVTFKYQDTHVSRDQTKLVVGVVLGLLVATVLIGLAYWLYLKKSKQGSWKTAENENGSSEEEKKLEEKVEENSQKAEV
ncbi:CD166 antigen homolog A isoform X2 [Oryzias latipes]|uniref:CD166 antigen homolog A isoform X2 n=1 Tax=Oryzias latipes TaxID=8090 RepID=UPI0002A47F00|nr:CD166 antigen homolog A isoform X2 [Oryzias latipes]